MGARTLAESATPIAAALFYTTDAIDMLVSASIGAITEERRRRRPRAVEARRSCVFAVAPLQAIVEGPT